MVDTLAESPGREIRLGLSVPFGCKGAVREIPLPR